MQVQKSQILFLSIFLLISPIFSHSNTFQEEIHEDAQWPKVANLDDGSVLIFSHVIGEKKCLETKLDKKGEFIYGDIPHNQTISPSDVLIAPHQNPDQVSVLVHNGGLSSEMITQYQQNVFKSSLKEPNSKYYVHKSVVALKNGKIIIAGIEEEVNDKVLTKIGVDIYDPKTNTYGNGLTLDAKGKMVSCYEQKENQVYCAYVIEQYEFVSKLILQHLEVNPTANSITSKASQVIKTFYTVFNYLKAIPFNEKEAIILFRVGNGNLYPRYGNTGKSIYYYHYELSSEETLVSGIRYEYLNTDCRLRIDNGDESIDIAKLSEKRIYIACETDKGRLKGFIIYPGKSEIDEFNFNDFNAKDIKNPVFAKFEKSLGIFYTHINDNDNYNVDFHLMNYPECINYYDNRIYIIPRYYSKEFDFSGKVFINNPYPASRQDEKVYIVFLANEKMKIVNSLDNKPIEPGKQYDSENFSIKITPEGIEGTFSFPYMATINDTYDGLIEGKICRITFNTPKCLDQCYSCSKEGTPEKHECLGCINESYYREEYNDSKDEGYGKPHNCERCNESCYNCYYKFVLDPFPTTNCKSCDYANGYYHLEDNEKICISVETQDYWEYVYNRSIYLDQTPENDNTKWRWKFCHKNCKKCSGPGTDEDNQCDACNEPLYFFCNQTKGDGIPGTCHADCENNGFFLKETEGMKKCCPCLDDCKVCPDENTCQDCYQPFYLAPNNDSCVEDCGYCYAKDNITFGVWRCVNCKEDYLPSVKYNLNGTCYDEIPLITYKDPDVFNKSHHIIDDKCNLLMGCKEGCHKCDTWYTEKCTECSKGFYKEDHWGELKQPHTFPCFTEDECHGKTKYRFNESLEIGGVCKIINGIEVCYNCKKRENNYRQVEDNFTCGPFAKYTFVEIPNYNKLSKCYKRCATCRQFGNGCRQNCITCKDSGSYYLDKYPDSLDEGDCKRRPLHKCGIYPYYHNYDLAEELGIDEDVCGQDCDVCLYDGKCTKEFPFYMPASRECVESCGIPEILGQSCVMDQQDALDKFMNDPFDINKSNKELIQLEDILKLIQISIVKKYATEYNIDIKTIDQTINNYIKDGTIFNLPNSQIIIGNNISIEITTSQLELFKLLNLKKSETTKTTEITTTTTTTTTTTSSTTTQTQTNEINIPSITTPTTTKTQTSTTITPNTQTATESKTETTKPINIPSTTQTTTEEQTETTKPTTIPSTTTTKEEKEIASSTPIIIKNYETQNISQVAKFNVEDPPIVNISECENLIKKHYNLSEEEVLLILKGTSYKNFEQYIGKDVSFSLISTSLWKILSLEPCKESHIKTIITNEFNAGNLLVSPLYQNKISAVVNSGYDVFSANSAFYNDLCTPFTNENGNDVLIDQRRKDYFQEALNICKDGCTFKGYNATANSYSCECPVIDSNTEDKNKEIITEQLPDDFYKEHTFSNIKVFKCASQVFSQKGQNKNFGSYTLLACLGSFVGVIVFYFIKGTKQLSSLISGFKPEEKHVVANPPKKEDDPSSIERSIGKPEEVNKDDLLSDYGLNNADYEEAKEKETRSYWKIYWSLLKVKQLFIFTFYTTNDGNLRVIKIGLFILFISFYFAYTALFFNDSIMRNIYEYKGNTNAAIHIPNIILSSLFCLIMNLIVKLVSLSERDLLIIKKDNKKVDSIQKKIKIKTIILFAVSSALILLCWYYVAAFCAIFKNSQGHYFINVLVSFIVCNLWPCFTSLIAPALRKYALKKESSCMYKTSKIVAYI